MLLTELLDGERTVDSLPRRGLSVSAASHHLRILRALRLVRACCDGRHVNYALHDYHIADLLAERIHMPVALPAPTTTQTA